MIGGKEMFDPTFLRAWCKQAYCRRCFIALFVRVYANRAPSIYLDLALPPELLLLFQFQSFVDLGTAGRPEKKVNVEPSVSRVVIFYLLVEGEPLCGTRSSTHSCERPKKQTRQLKIPSSRNQRH
jgi:hypothetical protein